jgi:hypothetical protein
MKKTITTEQALEMYQVLNGADYSEMEGADQVKLVKILLALEPTAKDYEAKTKTASDKLKEGFPGIEERLQKANQYRTMSKDPKADASELPMGPAEYHKFTTVEFPEYQKRINEAIADLGKKEVSIDIEPLTSDQFQQLLTSNKKQWKVGAGKVLACIVKL